MRHILSVCLCLALAACAATGVKVTDDQVASFKAGEATEATVVAKLGQPTARMRMSDGSVMLQYVYAESQVRAASFIPVVGLFAGGADMRSNAVILRFGPDGKLLDSSSSATQMGTGTGLSAGKVSPADTMQPRQ